MRKKTCKFKGCTNYSPKAKKYCCFACSFDEVDYNNILEAEKKNKKSKK